MQKRLRIVLATVGAATEQGLLDALPILSGSKQLKVEAVFVRDTSLLRAAALPFSREVLHGGTIRELSQERTRLQLNHASSRVQELLAKLTRQKNIPTSFVELEGFDSAAMETIVGTADFLVVARAGWPKSLRSRRAYRALPLVAQDKNTLFVNEPWSSGQCVVVAYDGQRSNAALRVASRYASASGLRLVIATLANVQLPDEFQDLPVEQVPLHKTNTASTEQQLAQLVENRDARLLILENTVTDNWLDVLPLLFDRVPCSVLHLSHSTL